MTETKVAFCWYDRDEWTKLKQVAADKQNLDDTYEEWLRNANSTLSDLRSEGQQVQKILMKIDTFERWCEEEGLENDSAARTRYAVLLLSKRIS